jgi:hypothetical protein
LGQQLASDWFRVSSVCHLYRCYKRIESLSIHFLQKPF